MAKEGWWRRSTHEGFTKYEIVQPRGVAAWTADALSGDPLDVVGVENHPVIIEGKGPVWMYAHAALAVARAGAAAVHVIQPQIEQPVLVHPLIAENVGCCRWFCQRPSDAGGSILEFLAPPTGEFWSPSVLGDLVSASEEWHSELLTITGRGANWMYAAAAIRAGIAGERLVSCFSPSNSFAEAVLVNPGISQPLVPADPSLHMPSGQQGRVVGILGDPGSGKSVFSKLLYEGFRNAELSSVVRLDCDHAAPTPDWYLEMLRQDRGGEAASIRNQQKRPWTHEAEQRLAKCLSHCAATMEWTIADFPGGNHSMVPAQRIPTGREVMLNQADLFVIVVRSDDEAAENHWRAELQREGMEARVGAVIVSRDPNEQPGITIRSAYPLVAEVTGLDRRNLEASRIAPSLGDWAKFARTLADLAAAKP